MYNSPAKRAFSSNYEFYAFIDTIAERLNRNKLTQAGGLLNYLIHKVAWTTSTELFGELRIALRKIRDDHPSIESTLSSDIALATQTLDDALDPFEAISYSPHGSQKAMRPNQTMQPTASRRTAAFSKTKKHSFRWGSRADLKNIGDGDNAVVIAGPSSNE